jgi:hypothetical protein
MLLAPSHLWSVTRECITRINAWQVRHSQLKYFYLPPAVGKGGKSLPPISPAESLLRHVRWRKMLRGTFSLFRQATFDNIIQKGLILTLALDRGLYL